MSKNKDTYYFSHDSNARNDEKILAIRMRHKAEGYAVYFMILERLRECTDNMSVKDYNVLAFDFRVSADLVKSVVEDYGLFVFTDDGKYFYSERMQRNMKIVKEKSEKAREAVKKRWKNQQKDTEEIPSKYERNTDVLQTYNERNTIKVKESKVKKSKVNNDDNGVVKKSSSSSSDNSDNNYISIEVLAKEYLQNEKLVNAVLENEKNKFKNRKHLEIMLKKFVKVLIENNIERKTQSDFAGHFRNWNKKQPLMNVDELNLKNEPIITFNDNVNPTKRQMPKSKFEQMQERNKAGGYVYKILKVSNGN